MAAQICIYNGVWQHEKINSIVTNNNNGNIKETRREVYAVLVTYYKLLDGLTSQFMVLEV